MFLCKVFLSRFFVGLDRYQSWQAIGHLFTFQVWPRSRRSGSRLVSTHLLIFWVSLSSSVAASAELGEQCIAVATGGLLHAIPPLREAFYALKPTLTLDGIRLAGEMYWQGQTKLAE